MSAMAISTATSFAQGLGPLALAPMFPQLMQSFNSDLAGVVQFTGVCILVLGFSNFFWYGFPPRHILTSLTSRCQGPHPNSLRSTTSPDLLHPHLPRQQYLACAGYQLRKLYGRMRAQRIRRRPCRDRPAGDHRRRHVPARARCL